MTGRSRAFPRRAFSRAAAVLMLASAICTALVARAEEADVPPMVQARLVAKLAGYDKHFLTRAGDRAHILIVTVKGDAESERMGEQIKAALDEVGAVGGLPHDQSVVLYSDAASLAALCRDRRASIAYLAAGLSHELGAIGQALEGVSVLSIGAVGGYAARGAVVEFFAEGGKPRIAVNLAQARKQQVAFSPEVLRIVRVIE